jgi:hypothetical protein
MKRKKPIDHLLLLREEIAALGVVKCHMSHERIRRMGDAMLPVACPSQDAYQRVGLCSPEVRMQRLGCSHTTARIRLEDAINELSRGNGVSGGPASSFASELNWLNNQIHLLDHRKGEAEKAVAKIEEEMHRAGNRVRSGEAIMEARKLVLEMERSHDEYVEQIGALRDRVVNELDRLRQ